MTLRLRLALFIATAIALALLAQGIFGYLSFERLLFATLDRDLSAYVGRIMGQLHFEQERGMPPGGPGRSLGMGMGMGEPFSGRVASARLIQNGVAVRTWGDFSSEIPLPSASGIADGSIEVRSYGDWRVGKLVVAPGIYLQAALQAQPVASSLSNYRQTVIFTVLLVSLLGALTAWWLSGPALRPLQHLLETTQKVAHSGDLSLRVPEARGGELGKLSQTFNEMMERLSAFLKRETEFTRNAAHELRTPLAAMRLQLGSYAHQQASAEETLQVVSQEVERMTRLSEALLTLAREGRSQQVGLDLAEIAREVAEKAGVPYLGPAHLELSGDPILLRQALVNLLNNARKHAPGAEARVSLEVKPGPAPLASQAAQKAGAREARGLNPSPHPTFAILSVRDNGPGMSPEALMRATEAFYRAPGTRVSGSGLGLSVVAQVAQVHGGWLELKSDKPGLQASLWVKIA
ncbi:MAG: HAMP domain-containing histidine kinase [Thermaceae bacterium]|nr:HAMP domain-containing histidine kinase [Thermaceae bacterium]